MTSVKIEGNRYVTVDSLYQWDLNQVLKIYGLSLSFVPSIHFYNDIMDRAIVRQATVDDAGVISVDIPNSLLQKAYAITVALCHYEDERVFQSLYTLTIPVIKRAKPSDYTLTTDDSEVYSFVALENLVADTVANLTMQYNDAVDTFDKEIEDLRTVVNKRVDDAIIIIENDNNKDRAELETKINESVVMLNTIASDKVNEVEELIDEKIKKIETENELLWENTVTTIGDTFEPQTIDLGSDVDDYEYLLLLYSSNGLLAPRYSAVIPKGIIVDGSRYGNGVIIKQRANNLVAIEWEAQREIRYENDGIHFYDCYSTYIGDYATDNLLEITNDLLIPIKIYGVNPKVATDDVTLANSICPTKTGTAISATDSSDSRLKGLVVYGATTQNGTPTPTAPVDLVSVVNPVVRITGKNLVENTATTQTVSGVTFTVNSDGTVTADGTATNTASIRTCNSVTLPIGTYILSGCPSGGSSTTYDIRYSGTGGKDTGSGTVITVTEPTEIYVVILIRSGVTVDNITFKPMIRLADVTDDTYEPYKAQSISIPYTLNEGDYVDFEKGVLVRKAYRCKVDSDTKVSNNLTVIGEYTRSLVNISAFPLAVDRPADYTSYSNIMPFNASYTLDSLHFYAQSSALWVFIPVAELSSQDATGVKAWLVEHNAEFIYPLATPTETPLTAEEIEAFKQLTSYYPVTTITNSEGSEMSVTYKADTKLYIDNKLAELMTATTTTGGDSE